MDRVNDFQLERAFTRISNDMLETLYQSKDLKQREYKLLLCLIRHTNGYNCNERILKNSFLVKETGISRSHICDTTRSLLKRDIIFKKEDSYGINKESNFWKNNCSLPREQRSLTGEQKFPLQGTTVPRTGNKDPSQTSITANASSPLKTTIKKEINTTSYKQEKYFKSRLHPISTNKEWDLYIKSSGGSDV